MGLSARPGPAAIGVRILVVPGSPATCLLAKRATSLALAAPYGQPSMNECSQVQKNRIARMEATKQFLMPALTTQPRLKGQGGNLQGTFSSFEYIPSRFSLADELASKERVASETVRLTVSTARREGTSRTRARACVTMARTEDLHARESLHGAT